jgi:regulator of sirC expression with transglutaminase-like and TPR domain
MLPYRQNVAQIYRTLDWLRDSILNENRKDFDTALNTFRQQLAERRSLGLVLVVSERLAKPHRPLIKATPDSRPRSWSMIWVW